MSEEKKAEEQEEQEALAKFYVEDLFHKKVFEADSLDAAEKFMATGKQISAIWNKLEPNTSKSDISRRTSKFLIWIIISAMYDVMKVEMTGLENTINSDQKQQIKALKNRLTPDQAAENILQLYKSLKWLEASVNEKLIFEQMLLKLADFDRIKV